jgi:hypothetical protein
MDHICPGLIKLHALTCLLLFVLTSRVHADDAYIWQRQWSAELAQSIQAQTPLFEHYRVVGAQHEAGANWVEPKVNLAALKAAGKPLVLVLRLPGSAPVLTAAALAQRIVPLRARWLAAGVTVARVELDFDCAESQLGAYRSQLLALRALLPKELAIDITALPAWLKDPMLPSLLAATDRVTLQVHSVLAPKRGLFDSRLAESWVRQFSALSSKPFSVALPAYGAKLLLDSAGKVIGVEHEAELGMARASELELQTAPESVRALIDSFAARPAANLAGFVWFRLPLPSDERAWAPVTLAAVIKRQVLRAQIRPLFAPNAAGGFDVQLQNTGNVNASLPLRLAVNARCLGDGVGGYRFAKAVFSAKVALTVKPGVSRTIGWLRCPAGSQPSIARP